MKLLILLLLFSSSAMADRMLNNNSYGYSGNNSPSYGGGYNNSRIPPRMTEEQTDLYLQNEYAGSPAQQRINNARYAQMKAERAEAEYERYRQYENSRVDSERFISHSPRH